MLVAPLVAAALAALVVAGGALYLTTQIERVAAEPSRSGEIGAARETAEPPGHNVLVAGVRDAELERLALLHLSPGREAPVAVVLPPALTVEVPDEGRAPLAVAHAAGEPDALVEAVVTYSALNVHRYVEVDLEHVPELAAEVGGRACFGAQLAREVATALTAAAPLHPARFLRVAERAGAAVRVDRELGRIAVLSALWDLRGHGDGPPRLVALPVRRDGGELRALIEPTERIFQALRSGAPLPAQEELVEEVVRPEDVTLAVLNGTGVDGLAARTAERLEGVGFRVAEVGNAPTFDVAVSEVHHAEDAAEAAELVAAHLPGSEVLPGVDEELAGSAPVVLVLGEDRADGPDLAAVELPEPAAEVETPESCW